MELLDIRLTKGSPGYGAQVDLVSHLQLAPGEPIPWSFTIMEIVKELHPEWQRLRDRVDWGHHTGRRKKDEMPERIRKRFDEQRGFLIPDKGPNLLGNLPGGSQTPNNAPPLTVAERNRAAMKRFFEYNQIYSFYTTALTYAANREKNRLLRKTLAATIAKTIDGTTRAEMRGKRRSIDKYKYQRWIDYNGVVHQEDDDETTISIKFAEVTKSPIKVYKSRRGRLPTVVPSKISRDHHTRAVMYIDWRRHTISDEQSARGKFQSFWSWMLNWIKEELLQEVIESLILGVLKGVKHSVKFIYRAGKALRHSRRIKSAQAKGEALGSTASRLMARIEKRRTSLPKSASKGSAGAGQSLSPGGHSRATSPAEGGLSQRDRGLSDGRAGRSSDTRTGRAAPDADDIALDRTFRGGLDEGEFATSAALKRGNFGERTATDVLATQGHKIIDFKPSILGTNQGGIDMVTLRDGIVYLVDNKALTRSGNVSSVSALTTNFVQNLRTVRRDLSQKLASHGTVGEQRRVLQEALDAIDAGRYSRVVTNANLAPDAKVLSGVSQKLQSMGIGFIDVMQ